MAPRGTGGTLIGSTAGLFERLAEPARSPQEIWQWLLGLAPALLLIDVTARRLGIPDLAYAVAHRLFGSRKRVEPPRVPAPIALLQTARDAARQKIDPSALPAEPVPTVVAPSEEPKQEAYLGRLLDAKKRVKGEK